MKLVIASTYAQAELAMYELRVPRNEWRLVRDPSDLHGVTADNVVIVSPYTDGRWTLDNRKRWDAVRRVEYFEQRDNVRATRVRT
jgi:hypothetical protein